MTTTQRKHRLDILRGSSKNLHRASSKSLLKHEGGSLDFNLPKNGSFRKVVPVPAETPEVKLQRNASVQAKAGSGKAAAKPGMWARLLLWLGLGSTASARYTADVALTFTVPPMGVLGPINGQVTGLPGGPALYKGIVLFNGQCNIWWDKGHNMYRDAPDQAQAQNAGLVLDADGNFGIEGWQYQASEYDVLATHIAVMMVPQTEDLTWPNYILENWYIHDYIWNDAVVWLFVDRSACTDQTLPCDEAHGAVYYVPQQPAPGSQEPIGEQNADTNCPPVYGPAPPGAEIIPGGPVANIAPSATPSKTPYPSPTGSNSPSASPSTSGAPKLQETVATPTRQVDPLIKASESGAGSVQLNSVVALLAVAAVVAATLPTSSATPRDQHAPRKPRLPKAMTSHEPPQWR